MGFFASGFLYLLVLAAIPLIIHLIQRIRLKKVYYSSLFFLSETKRETFSWLQLKEILLLIFRTLFIFLLFFSLARPYLKKKIMLSQSEASRIIVIDDSYSMSFNNSFSKAKENALKLIRELRKGSETAVLTVSGQINLDWTTDLGRITKIIDTLQISYSGNTLQPPLEQALILLNRSTLPRKEIFIITDMQKRGVYPILPRIALLTNKPDITIIDVGTNNTDNVGIEDIFLSPSLPTEDFPSRLAVTIQNYSQKDEKRTISVKLKFSERDSLLQNLRTEVSLKSGESKTISLDAEIKKPGRYQAEASLSIDSLSIDDKRYFVATVPEKTPILLVYENPEDIKYIEMALRDSYFNISTVNTNGLRQQNLKRYKAVGLFSPYSLTLADWQRLSYFLLEGGGIFVCQNREMQVKEWAKALNCELVLDGAPALIKSPGFVNIERVDYSSSVMEIFKDIDLSSAKFYSYWELNNSGFNKTLAYFSSNKPFLVEDNNRKVLVALTSFNLQTTDFMFKATFLPLIHRIFTYLSFPTAKQLYLIGDTINVSMPKQGNVTIITPKSNYIQSSIFDKGGNSVKFSDTKEPGFYNIDNEAFAVNVLAEEGDLTRISEKEVKNQNIRIFSEIGGKITDLSRLSLALAILFFMLELVLLVI